MRLLKNLMLCVWCFIIAVPLIAADIQMPESTTLARIGLPLHIIEFGLSFFICVMALKFFGITRPMNFFLLVYIAVGFFVINTLLYLLFFTGDIFGFEISFANVYIGSRIALIAMLVSLSVLFMHVYSVMKKKM